VRPGYSTGDFIETFDGTSAAAPHVAAAAALILAVMPGLNEEVAGSILRESADRVIRRAGWHRFVGYGRLNVFSALRLARRRDP
jgi:subtilisin family serine protease